MIAIEDYEAISILLSFEITGWIIDSQQLSQTNLEAGHTLSQVSNNEYHENVALVLKDRKGL